jgi:hypothetical protein
MVAKKAPAKTAAVSKAVMKKADAATSRAEGGKTKSNLNRVTSNIPSVYQPGNAVSLSKVSGSRGLRTEPTKIVRNGPYKTSALVTQVKSGAPATANMAKPGKGKTKKK